MNKYEAISEALPIVSPNILEAIEATVKNINKYGRRNSEFKLTYAKLVEVLSKPEYSLADELDMTSASVAAFIKRAFQHRKPDSSKLCTYILAEVGYKCCYSCNIVKLFEEFRKNTASVSGYNTYCKDCHLYQTTKTQGLRQSMYRAAKLNRQPSWASTESIKTFYANCPKGYHVDHIIPLQGTLVSGLHVIENLQYLVAADNCSKSNKYTIE